MTRIYYHQRARPRSLLLLDKTGYIKKTAPCIGTAKDGHEKEKSLSVLLYREREKKTMGNLTDTDIMIALGLFESYLQSGETFDIPEEFDSPEAQAFVAGMIARKRYVLEGVKKDVR